MKQTTACVLIVTVMTLCGCSAIRDFKEGFERGFVREAQSNANFHEGFRRGFKRNFLRSCEGGSSDPHRIAYCTCADTELEKRFDDEGLMALSSGGASAHQQAAEQEIIRACRSKAFAP